jgi:hypothetical protein
MMRSDPRRVALCRILTLSVSTHNEQKRDINVWGFVKQLLQLDRQIAQTVRLLELMRHQQHFEIASS